MCGIVGLISNTSVLPVLLRGLQHLEYRGYDSAGAAVTNRLTGTHLLKTTRKVQDLIQKSAALTETLDRLPTAVTHLGVAHTRWATHGIPSDRNAHPHWIQDRLLLVHNGIIENYAELREALSEKGYTWQSETDTEIAGTLLYDLLVSAQPAVETPDDYFQCLRHLQSMLMGAYAFCWFDAAAPDQLWAMRMGSPLVLGQSTDGFCIASDSLAFPPTVKSLLYLEEGSILSVRPDGVQLWNRHGSRQNPKWIPHETNVEDFPIKGHYDHFMVKEIFEQPLALKRTFEYCRERSSHLVQSIPFEKIQRIQIVACGSSYYAGCIAQYWFESVGIPCRVEIASEFRYRTRAAEPHTLLLLISQSGETADTLAVLRDARQKKEYAFHLSLCNVQHSSLVRESDFSFLTQAGREIGVVSTKAFTAQLLALLMLCQHFGQRKSSGSGVQAMRLSELEASLVDLPRLAERFLATVEPQIKEWARQLVACPHLLFVARGDLYPIALEGALKLKELAYIHAQGYPAGELKHGPLALVEERVPVIALINQDSWLEKLRSNLEEIRSRRGHLFLVAPEDIDLETTLQQTICYVPTSPAWLAPILYTIPLQLLAYEVAHLKQLNIDQPRNLAKSVTVE